MAKDKTVKEIVADAEPELTEEELAAKTAAALEEAGETTDGLPPEPEAPVDSEQTQETSAATDEEQPSDITGDEGTQSVEPAAEAAVAVPVKVTGPKGCVDPQCVRDPHPFAPLAHVYPTQATDY